MFLGLIPQNLTLMSLWLVVLFRSYRTTCRFPNPRPVTGALAFGMISFNLGVLALEGAVPERVELCLGFVSKKFWFSVC